MTNHKLAEILKWYCLISFGALLGMAIISGMDFLK